MKVIALVKMNDSMAVVLDEMDPMTYMEKDGCILGTNGVFVRTLYKDHCDDRWKAFGGSKFDITLEDGSVIHCYGQYWDGVKATHRAMVDGEIVFNTPANTKTDLSKCYVYMGHKAIKHKFIELVSQYKGPVYDYWDYELLITKKYKVKPHKLRPVLRKLRRQMRKGSPSVCCSVNRYGAMTLTINPTPHDTPGN